MLPTYQLTELDRTRLAIPIAEKRIKTIKKRHDKEPCIEGLKIDDNNEEMDMMSEGSEE